MGDTGLAHRLPAWLLSWLTSGPASTPATKHTAHYPPGLGLPAASAAAGTTATTLGHHLFLDRVDDLVEDAAMDVALGHPPELVPVPGHADHLTQVGVHPVVTAYQVPVICLPIFKLHRYGVILSHLQQ